MRFVQYMITILNEQPVLRRRRFFQGRSIRGGEVKDITWFNPNGSDMSDMDWSAGFARSFAVRLVGTEIEETDDNGDPIVGDTLFLMFNAYRHAIQFVLPPHEDRQRWERLLDTSRSDWALRAVQDGLDYPLPARSVAVFRIMETGSSGNRAREVAGQAMSES